ncbi:MAG: rRNA maturation RNase YbeY [Actinomycetota bacterium]
MEVFVANEQDVPVDEERLSALARHMLSAEKVDGDAELSVLLVTQEHMRRLNARFAGEDHVTDVLAFPMMEDEEESLLLGDVVICPRVASRNATAMGHAVARELDVILVHGTLHLLGYDHQGNEDKTAMDARLKELLDSFKPTRV